MYRKADDTIKRSSSDQSDPFSDLNPCEVQVAINFLQNQRFENSFASHSDIGNSMHSTPVRLFLSAPGRIKDALLALAGAMMAQSDAPLRERNTVVNNVERCCKAMERLRQTDVSSVDDAKATLFVATSLISYNDMTIGHGFLPIARAALLAVKPWYHELTHAPSVEADPHLVPVLFAEISECLRVDEVPTLRYDSSPRHSIDPSFGVAQAILPYLYDICVLRNDFRAGHISTIDAMNVAAKIYDDIQTCNMHLYVDTEHSTNRDVLSHTQRSKIIDHGECYKSMAVLLTFQLRVSLDTIPGHNTALLVNALAKQLREDIYAFANSAQPQIRYLLFPYFIACTELQNKDEQKQVHQHMENLSGGIATQSCNRMVEFLQYVWAMRSVDSNVCWFDLVEDGIDFSIGP